MTVEMIDRETVKNMTEKFLEEGNEIKKSHCYFSPEITSFYEMKSGDILRKILRSTPRNWTEDHVSLTFHRKHPFEVLRDKERHLETWETVNERIELFKREHPDWRDNKSHLYVIDEMEWERDSHLI